jgi:hypothetical protein
MTESRMMTWLGLMTHPQDGCPQDGFAWRLATVRGVDTRVQSLPSARLQARCDHMPGQAGLSRLGTGEHTVLVLDDA